MKISPYLTFTGDCADAMAFYADALGAKITLAMTFQEMMGDETPVGLGAKIAHMTLDLGQGRSLLASDTFDASKYAGVEGVALHVPCETIVQAKELFAKLSEGGSVTMPFDKVDWSAGFGMCRDKFGVGWMVDCEVDGA